MISDTGWWWIRCYMTCLHSIAFLHCWVLRSIFLSTMYLFHYSLMTTRFMVSVLILLSFSRFIWLHWCLFLLYSTLTKRLDPSGSRLQSRPTGLLWAQLLEVSDMSAAEPLARRRGNLSRPDWHAEAPGPAIVLQGEGLWYEAPALCCRATGGSRLSLESELWNDTNLPEPHSLESPCNYTGRNGYKEHVT